MAHQACEILIENAFWMLSKGSHQKKFTQSWDFVPTGLLSDPRPPRRDKIPTFTDFFCDSSPNPSIIELLSS